MKYPLVTIIIPVYNAEKTLSRCINSVLKQDYQNIEVLIIDDGSTDNSFKICQAYAQMDDRVTYVHQENSGVASVRSKGLLYANGDYIIHVDSDDWIEKEYLKCLVQTAQTANVDVVVCDYYVNTHNNQILITQRPQHQDGKTFFKDFFRSGIHAALWNKLVNRNILKKEHEYFFKGINYCENILFWSQILLYKNVKIGYCHKALYHYDNYTNDTSITRNYSIDTWNMRCAYLLKLKELLDDKLYKVEIGLTELQLCREGLIYGYMSLKKTKKAVLRNYRYIHIMPISKKKKLGYYLLPICKQVATKLLL
mgnify:FL=1